MLILLTNDDGIHAPGLAAMRDALDRLGDVCVVAPDREQSGVGHSITFLSPLMAKEVFHLDSTGERRIGWAVEGSPADCVKLALAELCPVTPDLVVSGINGGLNVGVNVLYSGTVAAATEGALNDLPSIAVSLEYDDHARFDLAAQLAVDVIEQMLERDAFADHRLFSLNIPTSAAHEQAAAPQLKMASMGVLNWPAAYEQRRDPKGRRYYWAKGTPPNDRPGELTDVGGIQQGYLTLTPLMIDRTNHTVLAEMQDWGIEPRPLANLDAASPGRPQTLAP